MGMPGGYCSQWCGDGSCPGGSICVDAGLGVPICLDTCTSSAQCRQAEGYGCYDYGLGQMICWI